MAEADAYYADFGVGEGFGCECDEAVYPGGVGEGVVACHWVLDGGLVGVGVDRVRWRDGRAVDGGCWGGRKGGRGRTYDFQ